MIDDRDKYLISELPSTEYGQAFFKWLKEEIALMEEIEQTSLKICDDPLLEDFRMQLGIKIGLRRVLQKPVQCLNELK
uniref:Uncharacterized protein n=1 Tax=viral metagenome TaxID=1070528 RepID=A0A6M3IZZ7_9ZZZZ